MGDFRVAFCLCFKASPSAKTFIRKLSSQKPSYSQPSSSSWCSGIFRAYFKQFNQLISQLINRIPGCKQGVAENFEYGFK